MIMIMIFFMIITNDDHHHINITSPVSAKDSSHSPFLDFKMGFTASQVPHLLLIILIGHLLSLRRQHLLKVAKHRHGTVTIFTNRMSCMSCIYNNIIIMMTMMIMIIMTFK